MSLLITHHPSPIASLQISVGDLSELARPGVYLLAALASVWVFRDARRREGFRARAVWSWALLTLCLPPVVLPLYLAARLFTRRATGEQPTPTQPAAESSEAGVAGDAASSTSRGEARARADDANDSGLGGDETVGRAGGRAAARGFAPTLAYAAALMLGGAVYFYVDYRSFEARVARAERAKLYGRTESAVAEYRGALRLREDAHTRKLLALELLRAGRADEALMELRAASNNDDDEMLHFHTAAALGALGRREEAAAEYRRFLAGRLCAPPAREQKCEAARARLGPDADGGAR